MSEQDYIAGEKRALLSMLQHCCINLGYDKPEVQKASWIAERENAILSLRNICSDHGDNDWNESLNLSDIIEKHLHRNIGFK